MSDLQCEARTLNGTEPVVVTVGEIFQIECLSESIALNPTQVKLRVETALPDGKKNTDPYLLKLLKTDISPQGKYVMQVVSYRVGDPKDFSVELSDGINSLPIDGLKFKVESVIDQKNPPKGPFGPVGPFMTEFPWGGVGILIAIVVALIAAAIFKSLRVIQKKKLIQRMKQFDHVQLPVPQFYAEMRKLEREIDFKFKGDLAGQPAAGFILKFENALKLFITRQFLIPAYEWSPSLVVKEFRQRFVWMGEDMQNQLSVLLREMEKSQKSEAAITPQDVQQLAKNLKKWVDRASHLTDKYKGSASL